MAQRVAQEAAPAKRADPGTEPVTEYDSKIVMLRAERHDEIRITDTISEINQSVDIPDTLSVAQRTNTYFGPKLELYVGQENYMLTAPGPDAHLLLWKAETTTDGFRSGWKKVAEVKTALADEQPQYDLCQYCGEPLKTLEHERKAAVGQCVDET